MLFWGSDVFPTKPWLVPIFGVSRIFGYLLQQHSTDFLGIGVVFFSWQIEGIGQNSAQENILGNFSYWLPWVSCMRPSIFLNLDTRLGFAGHRSCCRGEQLWITFGNLEVLDAWRRRRVQWRPNRCERYIFSWRPPGHVKARFVFQKRWHGLWTGVRCLHSTTRLLVTWHF